jgi:hypothetical protein
MRLRVTVSSAASGDSTGVARTIREIVDETWKPYGLAFDWLEDTDQIRSWEGISVWIAAVSGLPVRFDGGDLGQTLFQGEAPYPLIRLSMDAATAWVLRYERARFDTLTVFHNLTLGDTAALVQRTLGYGAAHELGHFILGRSHASSGLMQPAYLRPGQLLRANPLPLDQRSVSRLASRLAESARCP